MPENTIYSSNGIKPVISNFGALVAISEAGVAPTSNDIIGELESASGFGFKTDNVDTTSVSSTSGFARLTPLKKTPNEGTISVFKDNENYPKVYNRYFGYNTSESGYFCTLTICWPKLPGWDNIKDLSLDGYISGFNWSDINTSTAQTFSFTFQPVGAPRPFNGFVDITSVSVTPLNLTAAGGKATVTVTGTNLIDNLLVKAFVNNEAVTETICYTTGSEVTQTASMTIPANKNSEEITYTIKASRDGGITYSNSTATLTVSGVV